MKKCTYTATSWNSDLDGISTRLAHLFQVKWLMWRFIFPTINTQWCCINRYLDTCWPIGVHLAIFMMETLQLKFKIRPDNIIFNFNGGGGAIINIEICLNSSVTYSYLNHSGTLQNHWLKIIGMTGYSAVRKFWLTLLSKVVNKLIAGTSLNNKELPSDIVHPDWLAMPAQFCPLNFSTVFQINVKCKHSCIEQGQYIKYGFVDFQIAEYG
jgi:hypothetical protein